MGVGSPYISRIRTSYIGENLHVRYLKCSLNEMEVTHRKLCYERENNADAPTQTPSTSGERNTEFHALSDPSKTSISVTG